MQIFYSIEEAAQKLQENIALTWGNFDGVHLGHQFLVQQLKNKAQALKLGTAVLTFDPRPDVYFSGKDASKSISSLQDRIALLKGLNIDYLLILPFNRNLATMPPLTFIEDFLINKLKVKSLVLGYDIIFGGQQSGNFALLKKHQTTFGYDLSQVEALTKNGDIISSSLVRSQITMANLKELPKILGRYHSLEGVVIQGKHIGSTVMQHPTANLKHEELLMPPQGCYACVAKLTEELNDQRLYPAACSLGTNPTFGDNELTLEAHLLNFNGNLYDKKLRLYFIKFLRAQKRFENSEELKKQIKQDIDATQNAQQS